MAYVKNIWVDQDVERPKTYEVTNNQDGSITLTDSFGLVTELGTPVNEVNMNHIEDGIDGCAIRKHNLTETFNLGEWVLGGTGDDEGIYKSLIANNVGNAITDDTKWEKVEMGGGASRNIGEIVSSTIPLTDAGLHLLDGALLQYGSYQAFIDYIADLYDSGDYTAIFDTEANWQTAVATYGICDKFVYDSVNNTVRLPKYGNQIITKTGAISTASTVPVLGTGKTLGLTDGSNTYPLIVNATRSGGFGPAIIADAEHSGSTYSVGTSVTPSAGTAYTLNKYGGITTDGTKSGIVADISSVKNYPLDCYYYIVIATSTKTQIQVDIDEIATDLNGKADVDLTNINASCKALDGQWVENNTSLASSVTSPTTTNDTYSLASFLPNDGYSYEVLFVSSLYTGSTSGNQNRVSLISDIITEPVQVCGTMTRSSSSVVSYGSTIVPVGVGRYISVKAQSNNTGTYNLSARAYRRIGTNS